MRRGWGTHGGAVGVLGRRGMLLGMGQEPWRCWYHCMCNTYGTWVRGDSRGWRERHHRKHVDGDYKHPPKEGTFEELGARSRELMSRDPIRLRRQLQEI